MDAAQIIRFLRGSNKEYPYGTPSSGDGIDNGMGFGCGAGIGYGGKSGFGDSRYRNGRMVASGDKWGNSVGRGSFICDTGHGDRHGAGDGGGSGRWKGVLFGNSDPIAARAPSEIAAMKTKFEILTYNGEPVYVVDGIPCVFQSIHDTLAKVAVISKTDFTSQTAFIAEFNGFFAHGETVRDALLSAKEKYYRNIDFEAKKAELKALFSRSADKKLSVRTLYEWHGMLTGSCCFGRDEFIRTHTFKYDDRLTLKEFVNLTAAHFGGEKIKELLE